ncbi:MAG: UDP-2-acetamido-2-deoxy-ribo-hexuluronate aminotransferase [Parasphingorhabdus sp.]|jgi:UDP-2-acetamido-2-deoxy-ribo-hexuluronate aminotransferase
MTDYLLHPDLVTEICCDTRAIETHPIFHTASVRRDGVWIYMGSIPEILNSVADRLGDLQAARKQIQILDQRVNWLSVLAQDLELLVALDGFDAESGQLLARLTPNAEVLRDAQSYVAERGQGSIPFIDLAFQQRRVRSEIESGLHGVLSHGRYIGGPEITELEQEMASYVGVRHAFAVSNGTDALLVALLAADVKPGDEVITSPFTFAATGEMIHLLGAKPVYVDIDPQTYNLQPDLIEAAITDKTKAIIPVGIFGQCADMDPINLLAGEKGIVVIEDAAQSFGATYKGRRSGAVSDIGCTSFFPSKPLGGYGDSGACFTNSDSLAEAIFQIRDHGQSGRYQHTRIGINGRMSSFQASVLLAKLSIFPDEVQLRQQVAERYTRLLNEANVDGEALVCPHIADYNTSVYAQYSILVQNRDQFQAAMSELGIPTAVHYPVPLNHQPAMQDPDCRVPISEEVANRVVSLPMHPYMNEDEQSLVVDSVLSSIISPS